MSDEPVYTPRVEYQCDGSATHYQGCQCHEARRNARIAELEEANKLVIERRDELYTENKKQAERIAGLEAERKLYLASRDVQSPDVVIVTKELWTSVSERVHALEKALREILEAGTEDAGTDTFGRPLPWEKFLLYNTDVGIYWKLLEGSRQEANSECPSRSQDAGASSQERLPTVAGVQRLFRGSDSTTVQEPPSGQAFACIAPHSHCSHQLADCVLAPGGSARSEWVCEIRDLLSGVTATVIPAKSYEVRAYRLTHSGMGMMEAKAAVERMHPDDRKAMEVLCPDADGKIK